jgi:TonB dependent receptor
MLRFTHYDGPFALSEDFQRWNGLLRYAAGEAAGDSFSLTAMGYDGRWRSADQIPQRAVNSGQISRLGFIDPTNGGDSYRYSLNAVWQHREGTTTTRANVYGIAYGLDLFSNFTYALDYPEQGDQFEQEEQRYVVGGSLSRQWEKVDLWGHETTVLAGLNTRHDIISDIGLYRTSRQQRFLTVRRDDVSEGDLGLFGQAETRWTPWLRTTLGLRGDVFHFSADGGTAGNDGDKWDAMVSPKFTPCWAPGPTLSSTSTSAPATIAMMPGA